MQLLTNLKTKLWFLNLLWIIPLFCLVFSIRMDSFNIRHYEKGTQTFSGVVIDKKEGEEKNTLVIRAREKIQVYDYQKKEIELGDKVQITGDLKEPTNTRVFHTFRYADYLKSKKIFWLCTAEKITMERENNNWFYQIKQNLQDYLRKQKYYPYLFAFILGDTSYLDEQKELFQQLGISHLFAISGMHISMIALVLTCFFNSFFSHKITHFLISIFLLFYLFLTGFSPSIIRAVVMYISRPLNQSPLHLLLLLFFLLLFYNPYYIYHLGFLFSFTVSFYLIRFQSIIKMKTSYLQKLWVTSFIAFFASMPILMYQFHEINFFTIFHNMIFVPFVTFLLFPITILTFFFPVMNPFFAIIIDLFETLLDFMSQFSFVITFPHVPFYFYLLEFILSYLFFKYYEQKKYCILIIIFLFYFFHSSYRVLFGKNMVTMIDVGQGDAILLTLEHNQGSILIDTGGISTYGRKENLFLVKTRIIPYLKSLGIQKLDYLILSHGDYDHMGEASYLVENFKVEKVILNKGEYNDLELKLIKVLEQKKIPYYQNIKALNIRSLNLYFLNNEIYDNENDNSIVLYTKINQQKLLFMGDAGKEVEEDIIKKYNLEDIDILKVGHHGSDTSSSKEFIHSIRPKYSFISVGKNNRYGHPKQSVLDTLNDCNIDRTDQDGSIEIQFKKNGYMIRTYSP